MNRQQLLAAAKAECLKSFGLLLPNTPRRIADALFALAEQCKDFAEQRVLLDAYRTLLRRDSSLTQRLESNLAELIDRGIRTAYSPARPSVSSAVSIDAWSLVESSIIDDEIKLGKVTSRFHARSGDDIEELNLRIAALFQQAAVKERENPFRPYLFSRSISTAVNDMGLPPDAAQAMVEKLVAELLDGVADIYKSLNTFFEKNGATTRLPTAAKPSRDLYPTLTQNTSGGSARANGTGQQTGEAGGAANSSGISARADREGSQRNTSNTYYPDPAGGGPAGNGIHKVEQLMRMVLGNLAPKQHGSGNYMAASSPNSAGADHSGGLPAYSRGAPPVHTHGSRHSVFDNGSPVSDGWVSGQQVVADALKQFFATESNGVNGANGANGITAAAVSRGGVAALPENSVYHVLNEARITTLEDVLDHDGEIRNLIFESRSALLSKASDGNEMMTIDVVGMIFEFILRDSEVPAEVRAQLGRLQFLLLKIALVDPKLLTQKSHPARKFINRIGTIAQGVKQNDPFGARLTEEIRRIVEVLLAEDSDSDSVILISGLLEEFEAFVARDLRSGDSKIERAVEAIEEAERRSVHLARMTAQLSEVLSGIKTDPYLQSFLEKSWLRAVEKAEQSDAQLASRYRQLVPELVWSILNKRTDHDRSQLVALLPHMLSELKAGMDSVNCTEKQAFLSWLIASHTRAIKAVGLPSRGASLQSLRERFQRFTGADVSDDAFDEEVVEFDRAFIDDAIKELNIELDGTDSVFQLGKDVNEGAEHAEDRAAIANEDDAVSDENVMTRLKVGVPVEINFDGTPQSATLTWMNSRATNMLLGFEANDVPTMITVALFRRLLANGRARFMEVAPLFERAITALLDIADKVDEIYE